MGDFGIMYAFCVCRTARDALWMDHTAFTNAARTSSLNGGGTLHSNTTGSMRAGDLHVNTGGL